MSSSGLPPTCGSTSLDAAGKHLRSVLLLGRKRPLRHGQRYPDGTKRRHRHKPGGRSHRSGVRVRARIEAAIRKRDHESLPDRLSEIEHAGLGGLPARAWDGIKAHLIPREQCKLAMVNGYINVALGGSHGAALRKLEHQEQLQRSHDAFLAWEKERKIKAKQVNRERRAATRGRTIAAIVELGLHHGEQGVGFRSIARKYRITQASLRRLHERLSEINFFSEAAWEYRVDESGQLSSGSESESDCDE